MLKTTGHRLDDKHRAIIRKFARKWKMKEGPTLRLILESLGKKETLNSWIMKIEK